MPDFLLSLLGFSKSSSSRRARSGISGVSVNLACHILYRQMFALHLQVSEYF